MQVPSTLIISSQSSTSMEANNNLSCESLSYSFRLSFDAESFIEFDLKLMSMRWNIKSMEEGVSAVSSLDSGSVLPPSVSLDSTQSLLCLNFDKRKHNKSFRKYLLFLIMNLFKRMKVVRLAKWIKCNSSKKAVSVERGRGNRVFDVDSESCNIQDAVLHCKNSNLSYGGSV